MPARAGAEGGARASARLAGRAGRAAARPQSKRTASALSPSHLPSLALFPVPRHGAFAGSELTSPDTAAGVARQRGRSPAVRRPAAKSLQVHRSTLRFAKLSERIAGETYPPTAEP